MKRGRQEAKSVERPRCHQRANSHWKLLEIPQKGEQIKQQQYSK
jgi:hypothetical protein